MFIEEGFTFDDVLLLPQYSEITPEDVSLTTKLTTNITIHIPIVSSPMDTVTEAKMAIVMAREGGIGIIHRNMSIEDQVKEVKKVKRAEWGVITDPITLGPDNSIQEAINCMQEFGISGIPIVEKGKLVGIITKKDLAYDYNPQVKIKEVMTKNVITASEGISMEEAQNILKKHKIEKLPIVDKNNNLIGLITLKDIQKLKEKPYASKDKMGRLIVGAAIGVSDEAIERAKALYDVGTDVLVIDTAHGHTKKVIEQLKKLRGILRDIDIIAGNVASEEGAEALAEAGANAIKVGVGPGSICTTRIIAGVGVPQLSAIMAARKVSIKWGVPIIADGGIRYSGDVTKALAAGASSVMLGNLLAGTDEAPGETIIYEGRKFKSYRGMGSLEAINKGISDRYNQNYYTKFVPEGVSGRVPYRGSVSEVLFQLIGGIKAGFGYVGAKTIPELWKKAKFIKITLASLKESHAHNVIITHEAPNYHLYKNE